MASAAPNTGLKIISVSAMLNLLAARRRGPLETQEHELRQGKAEQALASLLELLPATDEELTERILAERRFVD